MVWWIFTGKGISFPTTVWPGCSPQTGISLHRLSTGEGGCSRVKGCVLKSLSRVWLLATPCTVAHQAPLSMGILQAFSTGVGCHFLLQRIFPTQELNLGLLHCRQTLYPLSHQASKVDNNYSLGENFSDLMKHFFCVYIVHAVIFTYWTSVLNTRNTPYPDLRTTL